MKLYRLGVSVLLLASPVFVMLSVYSLAAWVVSLIGGSMIFLGLHQRWGAVINLGLTIVGIDFLYHTIWTAFGLTSIIFISGFFFYLFTVHVLSSNLIEIERIRSQNQTGVLDEYVSATHHHLLEQVLGAFLVTIASEFIAWNSILGISINGSNAIFFFLAFGSTSALLLFLIFEQLPASEV